MYNIFTSPPFFEWDENKHKENQRKHGVSFVEARSVFMDKNVMGAPDLEHSEREERLILTGISDRLRVLLVCFCYRQEYSMIRIISARKADQNEEEQYWRMIG